MRYFAFDLDNFTHDVWHVLEEAQDGMAGHTVAFEAETKDGAISKILFALREHLKEVVYESDQFGHEV